MCGTKQKTVIGIAATAALLIAGGILVIYQSGIVGVKQKLVLYPGPETLEDATKEDLVAASEADRDITLKHCVDTTIKVNGQDCYVYDTNVNLSRSWSGNYLPKLSRTPITYFDFEGRADIEITVPDKELEKVSVSPLSYGIKPEIDSEKHTVSFSIKEPDTYTVQFNDSPERAVHIFANPLETETPDFEDENVIYVEPGEWDMNTIHLQDGQTLYIAGGAVVHGTIQAKGKDNITVMGRGIIDGSKLAGWRGRAPFVPLEFNACKSIKIQDILVLNSNAWVCQGFETEELVIDGLKIISCRPNSDGITLQSCRNVEVKNGFVRSWDDSLVVKNYYRDSNNIQFSNMQLWTDFAQSMEIGYETNKGKMENSSITDISFTDICVLHNFHKPVISVHNADDALVSGLRFQNITIEDAQMGSGDGIEMPYLIDLHIAQNGNWSSTKERGTIQNITIDSVKVLSGKFCESRIKGYDETHKITDITISNLEILGEQIQDAQSGKFVIDKATTERILFQ
ncbi:MAG: glycosyl hydrolase family 28 protein [Blautia sp.]|nr:glycosyl hydrolase family 28 protein [Lachnoclostridium sp.]MCM1210747.1 glycosyl hydrolase family 28 protein [Blautia sp.]